MNTKLTEKLASLPISAGVYYHLDKNKKIIYVGKAANLKARVRQYFHQSGLAELSSKDRQLRDNIADVQWRETDNALQALLLESEMIKRYQPKYNVLSRNQSFNDWYYIAFKFDKNNPHVLVTRSQADLDSYDCLGPYLDGRLLRMILKYLRKSFPFSTHKRPPLKACLDYHLGLCPGPETDSFNSKQALSDLESVKAYLKGKHKFLTSKLTTQMKQASDKLDYELAAQLRNQIQALRDFKQSLVFKDLNFDLSSDRALQDLKQLFNLDKDLKRIEAYDISHISGQHTVASMIVFEDGILQPALSRRFKSRQAGNNDYAQITDIIARRLKMPSLKVKPDLIVIDGGKAQVSAVSKALKASNLDIATIGLAKRKEQLIFNHHQLSLNQAKLNQLKASQSSSANFTILDISRYSHLLKFIQRLRDASHRKAIQYQSKLHRKASLTSDLVNLPGIGDQTYLKLIKQFGSIQKLAQASESDLKKTVNSKQLQVLKSYLDTKAVSD